MLDKAMADGRRRKGCSKKLQIWVSDLLSPSLKNVHFLMSSSTDLGVEGLVVESRVLLVLACERKGIEDSSQALTNYRGQNGGFLRAAAVSLSGASVRSLNDTGP